MSFAQFSKLIHEQYTRMASRELFVVGDDNRLFEAAYLDAFPEGTNLLYKTNSEHDCSCCKNFIRNLGNVVALLEDGTVQTVWDIEGAPYPYDVVAKIMANFVRLHPITNLFRSKEHSYGAEKTRQALEGGDIKIWNHLHGKVSNKHHTRDVDRVTGEYRTNVATLRRAITELKLSAVNEVLSLIKQNALYRGAEHADSVRKFRTVLQVGQNMSPEPLERFVWANAHSPAAHFRNSVIGTLVTDLSNGMDLEDAVKAFESKVAPTNYKRTQALITPRMVEAAMAKIRELDLEAALERRFAKLSDITINNVLWADSSARRHMKGGIESVLMNAATSTARISSKPEEISIDDFMLRVVPSATGMELLLENSMRNNLMSVTAPVHTDAGRLFKWNNDFAWSYNGNVTDSIKERVKAAGGNVTNTALRFSLAWFNFDDLDLHVVEPNGSHIYFGNKRGRYGELDVDMNAGHGATREPVENVSFVHAPDGRYRIVVDQYCARETTNVGCVVEIECAGKLQQLTYRKRLGKQTEFALVTVKNGQIADIKVSADVELGGFSQDIWGVKTETFVKVNTLMLSPNHWDGQALGNKHWFFILHGCRNDEPTRGIYNEFLSNELLEHRKVFEVLGDRTKCQPAENQLSGLGFSSTRNDKVTIRVASDRANRVYSVNF